MSEAGQDWMQWGAAAGEDPAVTAFAAGGALVLWGPDKHAPTGFVVMLLVLCLSLLRARQARADHWRPENSAARI